jgi:hypothetical protein
LTRTNSSSVMCLRKTLPGKLWSKVREWCEGIIEHLPEMTPIFQSLAIPFMPYQHQKWRLISRDQSATPNQLPPHRSTSNSQYSSGQHMTTLGVSDWGTDEFIWYSEWD